MYISKIILSTKKKADGVVEILNTKGSEFSLFDENFLKEIADMKEKNFALELLKRLLEEHIKKHAKWLKPKNSAKCSMLVLPNICVD